MKWRRRPVYTLSTQKFGFLSAGSKQASEMRKMVSLGRVSFIDITIIFFCIEKRYTVLCSYSNGMEDVQHAAIAVCVDSAAYITVCKSV